MKKLLVTIIPSINAVIFIFIIDTAKYSLHKRLLTDAVKLKKKFFNFLEHKYFTTIF